MKHKRRARAFAIGVLCAAAAGCGDGSGRAGAGGFEVRAIDGAGNNRARADWGAAGTAMPRVMPAVYADGMAAPAGASRPSARAVSNAVVAQAGSVPNALGLSSFVFQWGQFVDHDLDLSPAAKPAEDFRIPIPAGDPMFDPFGAGDHWMPFVRSIYDPATGTDPGAPRAQMNMITSFLDASNVYGSDAVRAAALRTFEGGRLRTSDGDLLPLNTMGLPNAMGADPDPTHYYVAGDERANEQVGLTAMHTLLVREHNRLARALAADHPDWDDERLYQRARRFVGALVQAITFGEFLPALLGPYAPEPGGAYDPTADPSVVNEFSTALFRVGHTMLPAELLRVADDGAPAPGGHLALKDAFFRIGSLAAPGEVDCILKGLAAKVQEEVDARVVDGVRNFLFGEPGDGGLDLAALNIQRGRDHGLPDYNGLRAAYGLARATEWSEITSDPEIGAALTGVYASVDDVDPWVGAIAEDHLPGAAVGPLVAAAIRDQFTRLRDGDRFWYHRDPAFTPAERAEIAATRLSDVIRRNTAITNLPDDVFRAG